MCAVLFSTNSLLFVVEYMYNYINDCAIKILNLTADLSLVWEWNKNDTYYSVYFELF